MVFEPKYLEARVCSRTCGIYRAKCDFSTFPSEFNLIFGGFSSSDYLEMKKCGQRNMDLQFFIDFLVGFFANFRQQRQIQKRGFPNIPLGPFHERKHFFPPSFPFGFEEWFTLFQDENRCFVLLFPLEKHSPVAQSKCTHHVQSILNASNDQTLKGTNFRKTRIKKKTMSCKNLCFKMYKRRNIEKTDRPRGVSNNRQNRLEKMKQVWFCNRVFNP